MEYSLFLGYSWWTAKMKNRMSFNLILFNIPIKIILNNYLSSFRHILF